MRLRILFASLGMFSLIAVSLAVSQDSDTSQQEGVTVLAKGPVHEAFATPATTRPRPSPIIAQQVPEAIEEMPPEQKPQGNNVQWIPGYWAWEDVDEKFLWVSGLWRDLPPGKQWVSGYWAKADGGAQWVPGYWTEAGQTEVTYLPPPPASLEAGPSIDSPGADYFYVPGCWVYNQARYAWRPGYWQRHYADWYWSPARYYWTPSGYVFADGYWDYPISRRGLLFAPAYIDAGYLGRPGWFYRPLYGILETALIYALFDRHDYGHYYFGNYYGGPYAGLGYVPWIDSRIGRGVPNPLYAQYRHHYQNPAQWDRNIRTVYAERTRNEAARPAATLAQQQTIKGADVKNRTLVAPLAQVSQATKLQKVSPAALTEEIKNIKQARAAREERQKVEASIIAKGAPPTKPNDPPRAAKISLPKQTGPKAKVEVKPPPAPKQPKSEPRSLPKADPIPPPVVVPKTQPKKEPAPKIEPKSKAQPKPLPKGEPQPTPKSEPKAQPKPPPPPPAPKVEPNPAPKPKSEPKPSPAPPRPKDKKDKGDEATLKPTTGPVYVSRQQRTREWVIARSVHVFDGSPS